MFFSRRPRTGSDRFLPVKLAALVVGGILGLVGMRLDNSLLVSLAMGIVLVGFLLRFVRDSRPTPQEPEKTADTAEPPPADADSVSRR